MGAIGVTVVFVVEEHGWVKAQVLGLPVTVMGRDRAEAEAFVVEALRAHFIEASSADSGGEPLDRRAELCLISAEPPWRPLGGDDADRSPD